MIINDRFYFLKNMHKFSNYGKITEVTIET